MSDPGFTPYRLAPHVGTGEGCFWAPVAIIGSFAAFAILKTPDPGAMVIMAAVLGLPILALGLKVRRTRLRYETAAFEVTATPRIGGRLEGILHLPHGVDPESRVRGDLVCQRDGGADSPDPVMGRSYGYGAPAAPLEEHASQFPIAIDIPASGLPTGRNSAYWTLKFAAEAGFSGLDVAFSVFVEDQSSLPVESRSEPTDEVPRC